MPEKQSFATKALVPSFAAVAITIAVAASGGNSATTSTLADSLDQQPDAISPGFFNPPPGYSSAYDHHAMSRRVRSSQR